MLWFLNQARLKSESSVVVNMLSRCFGSALSEYCCYSRTRRRNQLSGAIVNIQVGNDGGLEYSSSISHGRREVRAF